MFSKTKSNMKILQKSSRY